MKITPRDKSPASLLLLFGGGFIYLAGITVICAPFIRGDYWLLIICLPFTLFAGWIGRIMFTSYLNSRFSTTHIEFRRGGIAVKNHPFGRSFTLAYTEVRSCILTDIGTPDACLELLITDRSHKTYQICAFRTLSEPMEQLYKAIQLKVSDVAHCVTALIAQQVVIERLLESHSLVAVDLRDGWKLVPLEDDDLNNIGLDFSSKLEGFEYLSPSLLNFCTQLSLYGPLVYFETEYFGGMGTQGAVAFADGRAVSPTPATGDGAINTALCCVGISSDTNEDEFDHIGLSRYRHTSDWKNAATG